MAIAVAPAGKCTHTGPCTHRIDEALHGDKCLKLNGCLIGDVLAEHLVAAISGQAMRCMLLKNNRLTDKGLSELVPVFGLQSLKLLDLSENKFSKKGTTVLARFLARAECLKLCLERVGLKDIALAPLLTAIVHVAPAAAAAVGKSRVYVQPSVEPRRTLTSLNLSHNDLTDVSAVAIASALKIAPQMQVYMSGA
jgi:hypothetical protein